MVVGIAVGSGIFRTPGPRGRSARTPGPDLRGLGARGSRGPLGALVFAELATRHPQAGGKYVYAREAYGRRAAFVVGWIEGLIYCAAIAARGHGLRRIPGPAPRLARTPRAPMGVVLIAVFAGLNLVGVKGGRWAQNLVTAAKVTALAGVVCVAASQGSGAGWRTSLPNAPRASPPGRPWPSPFRRSSGRTTAIPTRPRSPRRSTTPTADCRASFSSASWESPRSTSS